MRLIVPGVHVGEERELSSSEDDPGRLGSDAPGDQDGLVPRPSIPPVLLFGLAFWAGTAISYELLCGASSQVMVLVSLFGVIFGVLFFLGSFKVLGRVPLAMLVVAGLLLGCGNGGFGGFRLVLPELPTYVSDAHFALTEDVSFGEFSSSGTAVMILGDGQRIPVRVSTTENLETLSGRVILGSGSVQEPDDDWRLSYWNKGVVASVKLNTFQEVEGQGAGSVVRDLRKSCLGALRGFDSQGAILLQAILLGYREDLQGSELYQAVKVDGLAHLVAVSGAHLVIVCSLVTLLLSKIPVHRRWVVLLQLAFLVTYLILTAFPASAVRAAIMSSFSLIAFTVGRRTYSLAALGLCICIMVGLDPVCSVSLSFLLSASAVLGIALVGKLMTSWATCMVPGFPSGVVDAACLTVSSNVLTLPLCAAWFSQISLICILSNVIAAPCFALFCIGGTVCLILAVSGFSFGLSVMVLLANWFCKLLELLACIPFAAVACNIPKLPALALGIGALIALWVLWPRPTQIRGFILCGACVLISAAICVAPPLLHGNEIVMLDVGQGDAFVLRSGSRAVLVDTGTQDSKLIEGLARNGITSLDAVLITHPDDDHCGSLKALSGLIPVRGALVANDLLTCSCESCSSLREELGQVVGRENVVGLRLGQSFSWGAFRAKVLSPEHFEDEGGNGDSLVLHVTWDTNKDSRADGYALFTGDAESQKLDELLASGRLPDVDVLKVGHHGSKVAVDGETLGTLSPSISLISVGKGNRYGHPSNEALTLLNSAASRIYRTDRCGDVVCKLHDNEIQVSSMRRDDDLD